MTATGRRSSLWRDDSRRGRACPYTTIRHAIRRKGLNRRFCRKFRAFTPIEGVRERFRGDCAAPKLVWLPTRPRLLLRNSFCWQRRSLRCSEARLTAGGRGLPGNGLGLCAVIARCFREIGVLQPLVCAASRDKGAKSGPLRGDGLGEAVCGSQNTW